MKKDELNARRKLVKCHKRRAHLVVTCETNSSKILNQTRRLFVILTPMILAFVGHQTSATTDTSASEFSSFADLTSAVEYDELSKTLDRSGNEEWNLNQASTGSQLPEESQWHNSMVQTWSPSIKQGESNDKANQSYTSEQSLNEYPNQEPNERVDDYQSGQVEASESENQYISVVNNQSNIVFTEPIDIIKYSPTERSTTFAGVGFDGIPSGNSTSNHTITRYSWKSADNNDPIVSVIRVNNSNSSNLPRFININESKLNTTRLAELQKQQDDERSKSDAFHGENRTKKIFKSYSVKKSNPVIDDESKNRMIAYSPKEAGSGKARLSNSLVENRVVLAAGPTKQRKQVIGNKHQQQTIYKAPLIITEEQLKMIADSEDDNQLAAYKEAIEIKQPQVKDSFMFDASLLPMALNLMSSSSVSASELVPQTASYQDMPTSFESQQPDGRQHQKLSFLNTRSPEFDDINQLDSHHYQGETVAQHEPIVVETSPSASAVDGQTAAHITISNEIDNSDDSNAGNNSPENDASLEPFDSVSTDLAGETHVDADAGSSIESQQEADDQQLNHHNHNKGMIKVTPEKLERPDVRNKKRKKPMRIQKHLDQQQQNYHQQQRAQKAATTKQQPEQELLVGPFKSESEAPNTITLSGVVYQKSGSSSSIVKSVPSASAQSLKSDGAGKGGASSIRQTATTLSVGGGGSSSSSATKANELGPMEKYWPYSSAIYVPPSLKAGSSTQLASVSDILLGSVKSGEPTHIRHPQASSSSTYTSLGANSGGGGLRSSPFTFSSGALLTASNNNHNTNNNNNNPLLQSLQLEDLDLLSPPRELVSKLNSFEDSPSSSSISSSSMTPEAVGSLLDSAATSMTAAASLSHEQAAAAGPVWASSSKKGEQYYLGSLNSAPTDGSYHYMKHKEKSGPIVIVQKDVKPMKYHLLRAYLKLRRLLRPFDATYVFPNVHHPIMKRGQRARFSSFSKFRKEIGSRKLHLPTNSSAIAAR